MIRVNEVPPALPLREAYRPWLDEHRAWLMQFGEMERTDRWEQLLTHQPEPAIVEACVRSLLASHVDLVEPAENLSHGGPDFRCRVGRELFYVESACMTTEMVKEWTNLSDLPNGKASYYRHLTPRFLRRCQGKEQQCAVRTDGPCLLAIGTLHVAASALCFRRDSAEFTLMSQPKISCRMDVTTGKLVGEPLQETDLEFSAFVRPAIDGNGVEPLRRDISALLLCGFGAFPPPIHGALHPAATRPFDRRLLAKIPFCRLTDSWPQGRLQAEWV
jgi:hypothetical protein